MSKLINMYKALKKQDSNTFYLFKSGIFYIFLDEDAKKIGQMLPLKLTYLTNDVLKCGFPCSAFDRYNAKFTQFGINVKIVENNTLFTVLEYTQSKQIDDLICSIKHVDIDNLSVSNAYEFIETLKEKVKNL